MIATGISRCSWCENDPLNIEYHDHEWGLPQQDEHRLFEMLTLEGAQAGLSWLTILRKRSGYLAAFVGFDPGRVAGFDARRVERLLADPGIVRHRGKIEATVNNARRILALWEQGMSLSKLSWEVVDDAPRVNQWRQLADVPGQTEASRLLSRRLKDHGFRFVGPTTCYAYMQAAGMVNDHLTTCFRHPDHAQLHRNPSP
jgi:DNA-3-methyladenine glycosylase I